MPALLNPHRAYHQFLCALLAALTTLGPIPALAQQPNVAQRQPAGGANSPRPVRTVGDTTLLASSSAAPQSFEVAYAVPNACVLIALRPAQLLNSPMAELYPTEVLQAAALKHAGIDPLVAEHIIFSLAPTIGGEPSYSVFARFNTPFQLKPSDLTAHTAAADVEGKSYLKSNDPKLPSICALDEQSLLAAPDYFLRNLVRQKNVIPVASFAAAFKAADRGDDLLAMVDISPLRMLINMGLSQAPTPPEFTSAKQLPNLIRFIELRANFSRPGPSSLVITANNEADAEKVVTIFNEVKQLLTAKWAIEAQKQLASEDPVEQAAGRYSLRMSRLVDDQLQLQREREQLVLFRGDLTGQGANPMFTIATVGTLVGLLLPAVQAARDAARRNMSMNNLKQIMLALHNHEAVHKQFPAPAIRDESGKPLLSWRVAILPFIEQAELYNQFHLDEPWDSEHNKQLIARMPEIYLHPNSKLGPAEGKTNYLGVAGKGNFFDDVPGGQKMVRIADGTTNTIAVVEVDDDRAAVWTKPEDWTPDADDPLQGLGNRFAGDIFLTAFVDGHVTAVSRHVDLDALRAMFTTAGDEPTP